MTIIWDYTYTSFYVSFSGSSANIAAKIKLSGSGVQSVRTIINVYDMNGNLLGSAQDSFKTVGAGDTVNLPIVTVPHITTYQITVYVEDSSNQDLSPSHTVIINDSGQITSNLIEIDINSVSNGIYALLLKYSDNTSKSVSYTQSQFDNLAISNPQATIIQQPAPISVTVQPYSLFILSLPDGYNVSIKVTNADYVYLITGFPQYMSSITSSSSDSTNLVTALQVQSLIADHTAPIPTTQKTLTATLVDASYNMGVVNVKVSYNSTGTGAGFMYVRGIDQATGNTIFSDASPNSGQSFNFGTTNGILLSTHYTNLFQGAIIHIKITFSDSSLNPVGNIIEADIQGNPVITPQPTTTPTTQGDPLWKWILRIGALGLIGR